MVLSLRLEERFNRIFGLCFNPLTTPWVQDPMQGHIQEAVLSPSHTQAPVLGYGSPKNSATSLVCEVPSGDRFGDGNLVSTRLRRCIDDRTPRRCTREASRSLLVVITRSEERRPDPKKMHRTCVSRVRVLACRAYVFLCGISQYSLFRRRWL
jgi:hypothetical protein